MQCLVKPGRKYRHMYLIYHSPRKLRITWNKKPKKIHTLGKCQHTEISFSFTFVQSYDAATPRD